MAEREQCSSCRFSVKRNSRLFCRRFPPTVVTRSYEVHGNLELETSSEQPETESTDWCGEYVEARPC